MPLPIAEAEPGAYILAECQRSTHLPSESTSSDRFAGSPFLAKYLNSPGEGVTETGPSAPAGRNMIAQGAALGTDASDAQALQERDRWPYVAHSGLLLMSPGTPGLRPGLSYLALSGQMARQSASGGLRLLLRASHPRTVVLGAARRGCAPRLLLHSDNVPFFAEGKCPLLRRASPSGDSDGSDETAWAGAADTGRGPAGTEFVQ